MTGTPAKRALIGGLKFSVTLVAAYFMFLLVFASPYVFHKFRSPSSARECRNVRVGLTLREAEEVLRSRTEPNELRLTSSRQLISAREDGTCFIQLDANDTVVGSNFDAASRWKAWPAPW